MILRPFALVLSACVAGVLLSCAASALNVRHPLDPLSAAGLIFSLSLGALFIIALARLLFGALLLVFAALLLVAPVATWVVNLVRDPFGRRARSRQRALIDRLYPPPSSERRFNVKA